MGSGARVLPASREIIPRMVSGRLAVAALLLGLAPQGPVPETPPLVRYELNETWRWMTPLGERTRALVGSVASLGEKVRWELSRGGFPGTRARLLVTDGRSLALVDTDGGASARLTGADVRALFVPAEAPEPGLSSARLSDVAASLVREGPGAPFEGRPTVRYSLTLGYRLDVATPGRTARVKTSCRGSLVVVEEGIPPARTPPDDLLRLVPARQEARDALEAELGQLGGLVVRARITIESERDATVLSGASGPGGGETALKTTTLVSREVTGLSVLPASPEDGRRFGVPEEARLVGLERLLAAPSLP